MATDIFERWICRFGVPLEIITEQGKECCTRLTKDLFQLLQITHSTTTAYHPQCNSQAEVADKMITKYLTSYISETTLDWEDYLAPMMFLYNTSFQQLVQNTLFFPTHGMEARQPTFDEASNRIPMKGPHRIEQLKGGCDVTLKLASGRKTTAQVDRLKPYHQKNEAEVIQDEHEVTIVYCSNDEDLDDRPPPQLPLKVSTPATRATKINKPRETKTH